MNGNIRNYKLLNDNRDQKYADLSGMLAYMFSHNSKLNFEVSYRNQTGYQIGLDLLTARTEYTATFGKLYVTLGLELYDRNYLSERIKYKGVYAQISRRF